MTLLEVSLAMGLLVIVSSMTFWFYSSALGTSREGTEAAYRLRLAKSVIERIANEIRQAATASIDGRLGIEGDPQRIALSTYRVPRGYQSIERLLNDEPLPAQYDLNKVEYKLATHEKILHPDGYELPLGLARTEVLIPRPMPVIQKNDQATTGEESSETQVEGGESQTGDTVPEDQLEQGLFPADEVTDPQANDPSSALGIDVNWEELYSPEIRYLRFCYYDGKSWWDSWHVTGDNALPQLVEITVGFDIRPPFGESKTITETIPDDDNELADPDNPRRLTPGQINDEFCTCQNQDPIECVPLAHDLLTMVVRLPQADPLFRSRVSRETQSYIEEMATSEDTGDNEKSEATP